MDKPVPDTEPYFFLQLSVTDEHADLADSVLRQADSFFDFFGGAEQCSLGDHVRLGKDTSVPEHTVFARFLPKRGMGDDPLVVARRLEAVLRSLIETVNVKRDALHVFVKFGKTSQ